MDNIDDLMRKKFDSDHPEERFEFQEEFWEQAQALLEQEETRRRKRGAWFARWVLALGLALLLLWCLRKPVGQALGWADASYAPQTEGLSTGQHSRLGQSAETTKGATEDNASLLSAHSAPISSESKGDLSDANSPISGKNNPKNIVPQTSIAEKNTQKTSKNLQKSSKSGLLTANSSKNGIQSSTSSPETNKRPSVESEFTATPKTGISNQPDESRNSKILESAGQKELVLTTSPSLANNTPGGSDAPPLENAQTSLENLDFFPLISPIRTLPNPIEPLIIPQNHPNTRPKTKPSTPPLAQKPAPQKTKRRVSMGLTLAASAYNVPTGASWVGGLVGVSGSYRLNKDWSLGLGVQGRFIPGQTPAPDSANPTEISQLRFSFGFEEETWTRKTLGLYGVEVPISALWNRKKWHLEAGTTLGWLVSVHDKTTYKNASSLGPNNTSIDRNVKGDKQLYQPMWATAFVGAEYRLTSRLSLSGRLQQRFQPLFKSAESEGGRPKLGYFDLGMRIRLY